MKRSGRRKGDFIVFTDHDDVLAVDALYEMAKAIEAQPGLDAIYTDEDKINRSGTAYLGRIQAGFQYGVAAVQQLYLSSVAVRRDC